MKAFKFRAGFVGVLALLMVAMTLSTALAGGSPHFIKNATDVYIHMMGCLHSDFKEAGLASGAVETITLKGTAAVTFVSVNNGGNLPQAAQQADLRRRGQAERSVHRRQERQHQRFRVHSAADR